MDHHCPWTANCVSHTTFPHFLRFLLYTSAGLSWLEYLLSTRISHLWSTRHLPAYLGPHPLLVAHLAATTLANTITLFALSILLIRNIWSLAVNTTTIEGWEIERHSTLLRRARHFGGVLTTPEGTQVAIRRQEFPYDVGIAANIVQGMGTANPLSWLNPFAATPDIQSGIAFPTNGFEDESTTWPPPDPDRAYKRPAQALHSTPFTYATEEGLSAQESVAAFRERQVRDAVRRRRPFVERVEAGLGRGRGETGDGYEGGEGISDGTMSSDDETRGGGGEGEEAWRNSEGERLMDFGVDEEVEFYDEQEDEDEDDDVPLGELMARRRAERREV